MKNKIALSSDQNTATVDNKLYYFKRIQPIKDNLGCKDCAFYRRCDLKNGESSYAPCTSIDRKDKADGIWLSFNHCEKPSKEESKCKAIDHPGGVGMVCECGQAWLYCMPRPPCIVEEKDSGKKNSKIGPAEILESMAATYRERNKTYADNYKMVGPIMKILFPNGVPAELLGSDQFHLFELKVVKMTRFAISNLEHLDSIHDDCVYSAMIESILTAGENKNG